MGKRQIRISTEDFEKQKAHWEGKYVNLILKDGRTFYAQIILIDNDVLVCKDAFQTKHSIAKNAIQEIIIDYTAAY
jgi:hypothetical protein